MRVVPAAMTEAWEAEDKTGPRRPVIRATIQKVKLMRHMYETARAPGGDFEWQKSRSQPFTTIIFGEPRAPIEIRNIKNFTWTRSVNQDVAEATMTILNAEMVPIGEVDTSSTRDVFERPGFFTNTRSEAGQGVSPWGYPASGGPWAGLFAPDRLVRTYEGYGADYDVVPGRDANLLQSGTWLIDEVTYSEGGEISLRMRDVGRLLMDQICFPPVIPLREYPLTWSKIRNEQVPARDATGGTWKRLTSALGSASSSNSYFIGEGFTNEPWSEYVSGNGSSQGHHPSHVLDTNDDSYWLSTGMDRFWDRAWWEFTFKDSTTAMNAIRIKAKGGPYRVYVSLHNGTKWLGTRKIGRWLNTDPSSPSSIDTEHDIPWVKCEIADRNLAYEHVFPRKYGNIAKVRLTFTRLTEHAIGEHPFFAGLRAVHVYTAPTKAALGFAQGTVLRTVGNYRDYTDIVKWVAAWGGFYWPGSAGGFSYQCLGPGDNQTIAYTSPDPVLPRGNAWGDFMNTGTAGIADLTAELFDKKPLLDVIAYVRDIVGFNFWIDETGAVVWRMPNIWKAGNYLSPTHLAERTRSRTSTILSLNTDTHLQDYQTTLDSRNLRERVFVGDTNGKAGTVIRGYRPYVVNFRRVSGWTDQHFETEDECAVMADMIAARQMFSYRKSRWRIAGYPAIQIDDQIRLYAPVSNETYYHYVESITSTHDCTTGEWTYDVESHWLGKNLTDAWVVDVEVLPQATKNYLQTMGVVD